MIDKNKIIQCIQDFNGLDSNTLTDLQITVEKYPYFQTAQLLYFINLYKENNQLYNTQLKFAAAYASDRTLLHKLVNDFNNQKKTHSTEQSILNDNNFAIQNQEVKTIQEEVSKQEIQKNTVATENKNILTETKPVVKESFSTKEILLNLKNKLLKIEAEKKEFQSKAYHYEQYVKLSKEEKQKKNREIIDNFIAKNPSITRVTKDFKVPENIEMQEELVIEDIATETLANIYVKQNRIDKAIEIYAKLILKFPEKSSYFAVQIENLKKKFNSIEY